MSSNPYQGHAAYHEPHIWEDDRSQIIHGFLESDPLDFPCSPLFRGVAGESAPQEDTRDTFIPAREEIQIWFDDSRFHARGVRQKEF